MVDGRVCAAFHHPARPGRDAENREHGAENPDREEAEAYAGLPAGPGQAVPYGH